MAENSIDLSRQYGFETQTNMIGKVNGEFANVVADLVCVSCPIFQKFIEMNDATQKLDLVPHESSVRIDSGGWQKVLDMARAVAENSGTVVENMVFSGRSCMAPSKKYILAGPQVCNGKFNGQVND